MSAHALIKSVMYVFCKVFDNIKISMFRSFNAFIQHEIPWLLLTLIWFQNFLVQYYLNWKHGRRIFSQMVISQTDRTQMYPFPNRILSDIFPKIYKEGRGGQFFTGSNSFVQRSRKKWISQSYEFEVCNKNHSWPE